VTIRSASGSPVREVSAEAMDNPDTVRYVLEYLIPPEGSRYSASQAPFVGDPLVVSVPTSYTTHGALLWYCARFYQYRKLVVIVEYQDGKREGRVVDIPDLHKSRMVAVEVP
jgi:hypothetical protein